MVSGLDVRDRSVRMLDQSRIGAVLTHEASDLKGGPPVTAMLIQNTNPASVAPDQNRVAAGFSRPDLFVAVHEQFLTETAAVADIVLPATQFLEHDDIYKGGGHQYILFGGKLIEPPGDCVTNHSVICGLAERLGASHPGFAMSEREHIDWMLKGGFKWWSQHLDHGGCDDHSQAAIGLVWTQALAVAGSAAGCGAGGAKAVLGGDCGRGVERRCCGFGRRPPGGRRAMVPEGRRHGASDVHAVGQAIGRPLSLVCRARGDRSHAGPGPLDAGGGPSARTRGVDDLS
jgi:hypothetical protein